MKSKSLKIGYFGIPGSFTYKAARSYFDDNVQYIALGTFRDIFQNVKEGKVDYGVIPIENTLAGSIYENYDLLCEFNLFVCGETKARVSQSLLVSADITKGKDSKTIIKNLRKVYSHEKALEQCSTFFKEHPWIKPVAYTNTADSAHYVAEQKNIHLAAIADKYNAELYDLSVVVNSVENNKYNFTRFLIISNNPIKNKNSNKCSMQVKLTHESGSLSRLLNLLSELKCNLTKIESRPDQKHPFEYVFYIDFIFNNENFSTDEIVNLVKKASNEVRLLGSYRI